MTVAWKRTTTYILSIVLTFGLVFGCEDSTEAIQLPLGDSDRIDATESTGEESKTEEESQICLPCDADQVRQCVEDSELQRCTQTFCKDGCMITERKSKIGLEYGHCVGPKDQWCQICQRDNTSDIFGNTCDYPWLTDSKNDFPSSGPLAQRKDLDKGPVDKLSDWSFLLLPGERWISEIGPADGLSPLDIQGDTVVWCNGATGRLFYYQISDNWVEEVAIDGVGHLCWWVTVSDGKIYTISSQVENRENDAIFEIDIQNHTYRLLDVLGDARTISSIHARDGYVTWQHDNIVGHKTIALLDLDTLERTILTDGNTYCDYPNVSSTNVVWENLVRDGSSEIWFKSIDSVKAISLTPTTNIDSTMRYKPSIDNHFVVWGNTISNDMDSYIYKIIVYDFEKKESTEIPTVRKCGGAWVNSGLIAYREIGSDGRTSVKIYNIDDHSISEITMDAVTGYQCNPRLSGRWLVYLEYNRFPTNTEEFPVGSHVVLFDLCTHEHFQSQDFCQNGTESKNMQVKANH